MTFYNDFLHEDKHQSFVQANSIVFTDHSETCPKRPKQYLCNSIFAIFHLIKERRNEVDFLHADKHQIFLQLDTIKYYCAQITQNNKFAESL